MLYSHICIFTDNCIVHPHSTCLHRKFTASYNNISIFFCLICEEIFNHSAKPVIATHYWYNFCAIILRTFYKLNIDIFLLFRVHTLIPHAKPLQMSYLFLAAVVDNRVYKKRIQFIIRYHILFMRCCCDAVNNGTRLNTSMHSCENINI